MYMGLSFIRMVRLLFGEKESGFLVACTRLYNPVRLSVRQSIGDNAFSAFTGILDIVSRHCVPTLCLNIVSPHCVPILCLGIVSRCCFLTLFPDIVFRQCPDIVSRHCVRSLCPDIVSQHCVTSITSLARDLQVLALFSFHSPSGTSD